jgi:hypothetical protein
MPVVTRRTTREIEPMEQGEAPKPANKPWRPKLTGYRLLYIVLTAGFGISKAVLSYEGYSTAPNTLDWIYGVGVFLL